MGQYRFTGIKPILAKVNRDFKGLETDENDLTEWIGEALGRMQIYEASQEATLFSEVKNHHIDLPPTLHNIIQVAKDNKWSKNDSSNNLCPDNILCSIESTPVEEEHQCEDRSAYCNGVKYVAVDCDGYSLCKNQKTPVDYKARFDLNNYYPYWVGSDVYQNRYELVTLADHTFFNSIVCRPNDNPYSESRQPEYHDRDRQHTNQRSEYSIVGDGRESMRFSFKEGFVAVSYTRQAMQDGLPMVPDNELAKEAITYYLAWKLLQRQSFMRREGTRALAAEAKKNWLDYRKMFVSEAKMPKGDGQYLALREQMLYQLPRLDRPYNFYGGMSDPEQRPWNYTHRNYE